MYIRDEGNMSPDKGKLEICQGIHPEKPVLEVSIKIGGKRSSDKIQDLDCIRLGHHLHNIVKLALATSDSFSLLSGQKGGSLTVMAAGRLAACSRNILVFLEDSRISRYGCNLCKLCNQNPSKIQ